MTIEEFEAYLKKRAEAYTRYTKAMMEQHPEWYEDKGPADFKMEPGDWFDGFLHHDC